MNDAELMQAMEYGFTPAKQRSWELVVTDVSRAELGNQRAAMIRAGYQPEDTPLDTPELERDVPYLYHGNEYIMSGNFTMKQRHIPFLRIARGDVLLTGLGIGMVAVACTRLPAVTSVTVVEWDKHLIAMLRPQLPPEIRLERGDAYSWSPRHGATYDTIYHDIWSNMDVNRVWPAHLALMDRYRQWLRPGGWIGCFKHEDLRGFIQQMIAAGKVEPGQFEDVDGPGSDNLRRFNEVLAQLST